MRLAARCHRLASLLSRAHRQAVLALLPPLAVRLDWPAQLYVADSSSQRDYNPLDALAWAQKGGLCGGIEA